MILLEDSIRIPSQAADFDGFREWTTSDSFPEYGRIDFLAGNIDLDMSPDDLFTHSAVKSALGQTLRALLTGRAYIFIDRTRVVSRFVGLSAEPDLVVVLHDSVRAGKVRYAPSPNKGRDRFWAVEGAPDLVVEVISDSSEVKDTRTLPVLYSRAGVSELWTVDARGETLSFQISSLQDGTLVPVPPGEDGWTRSSMLGLAVRLVRFETDLSTWDYTLEAQPL